MDFDGNCNIFEALYSFLCWVYICPSSSNSCYNVEVLQTSMQNETVHNVGEALPVCCVISSEGDHKFCPGLNVNEYYDKFHFIICFHIKSVQLWDQPFKHIELSIMVSA